MNDSKIKQLVSASLLTALCCVATIVIQIPSSLGGYINLGDCIVLLSGFILGPLWGGIAGGIGSMLADIFTGYAIYAPGTLIIKFFCAVVFAFVCNKKRNSAFWIIFSSICGEAVMVVGYFLYSAIIFGEGLTAALVIPGNITQAVMNIPVAVIIIHAIKKFFKF